MTALGVDSQGGSLYVADGPARAQAAGRPGAAAAPRAVTAPAVVYVACDNSGPVTPITVATRKPGPQISPE